MVESDEAGAMVSRGCPLCDATVHEPDPPPYVGGYAARGGPVPFLQKGTLRLVRCDACSMVYASPVGEEFISGLFYDRLGTPFYLSPDKLESDYSPVRFER